MSVTGAAFRADCGKLARDLLEAEAYLKLLRERAIVERMSYGGKLLTLWEEQQNIVDELLAIARESDF